MENTIAQTGVKPLERRTIMVGFLLVGLAIAVTTVSYGLNMTFTLQWLVWIITAAFAGVALLTLEWPRAFRGLPGEVPEGWLRGFLLLAMPLAYVLGSQVCGLGLKACSVVCHAINLSLIGLATVTAVRLHRGQSVGAVLVPMVVLGLTPHCVCHAPINVLWHSALGGFSPTCNMVPLAATLFSVTALRGIRPRYSAALAGVMLGMIVFMAVGNPLVGFPWQGCVSL
jgi:hypothetical protein